MYYFKQFLIELGTGAYDIAVVLEELENSQLQTMPKLTITYLRI